VLSSWVGDGADNADEVDVGRSVGVSFTCLGYRTARPSKLDLDLPSMKMGYKMRQFPMYAVAGALALLLAGCAAPAAKTSDVGASVTKDMGMPTVTSMGQDDFTGIATGTTRVFYIAADQVQWNYAPQGMNVMSGQRFTAAEKDVVTATPDRVGATYTKCVYRAYTDATFTELVPQDAYMGILGPTMHTEVGDKVTISYRNNCTFANSIHVRGWRYSKENEGLAYQDDTKLKADDAVVPGGGYQYHFEVPLTAGPMDTESSSTVWSYDSPSANNANDFAGLTGFIVVARRGEAKEDGSPKDVDKEMFSLFEADNENASALKDTNLGAFPASTLADQGFIDANMKRSLNGFVFGNGPVPILVQGTNVRWYSLGISNSSQTFSPQWDGNTFVVAGMRTDSVALPNGRTAIADMEARNPGLWVLGPPASDNGEASMMGRYEVK